MDKERLEELWADSNNWSGPWGGYNCAEDPRLIVPRRSKWAGWTLNQAHGSAWVLFFVTGLVAVVPTVIALKVFGRTPQIVGISFLVSIASIVGICLFYSSRTK